MALRVAAALEVFGEVVGFVSQPAQVDDLADVAEPLLLVRRSTRRGGRGRRSRRGRASGRDRPRPRRPRGRDGRWSGRSRPRSPSGRWCHPRCAPGGRPRSPRGRVRGGGAAPIRPCPTHRTRRFSWCCPIDEALKVASADPCVDACLDLVVELAGPRRRSGARREGGVVAGDGRAQLDTVGAAVHRERDRSGGAACEQAAGDRIGRRHSVRGHGELRRFRSAGASARRVRREAPYRCRGSAFARARESDVQPRTSTLAPRIIAPSTVRSTTGRGATIRCVDSIAPSLRRRCDDDHTPAS